MLGRPLQLPTRLALFRLATALGAAALPLAAALAPTPLALDARASHLDVADWHRAGTAGLEGGIEVLTGAQMELWRRQEAGMGGAGGLEMGRQEFVLKLVFSVAFVLLGGVFSGLSLGLMGLDSMNLQVLAASGPPRDRADAQKVLSLLSYGRHFVLVCLLLSNVVVNETLPVFLDSLTGGGGVLAVVISSAAIVIFGEVLPQALCARHGLRIGAACTGFVKVLMYLEAPICWPTAKLLDLLLGAHTTHLYRREELRTLVELHEDELGNADAALVGALLEEPRAVSSAMRTIDEVYCASEGTRVCDVDLKQLLVRRQHFLPVRRAPSAIHPVPAGVEQPFVGLVRVEELCAALSRPNELVRSLAPLPLVQVLPSTSIMDCVAFLKREDPSAVLLISNSALHGSGALGFATLDDLARAALLSDERKDHHRSVSLGATARLSLSRPPRASLSLGLGRFVQGLVDRSFVHRASSSQLSFRLSSDDDAPSSARGYRPLPATSPHSHHRTSSLASSPAPAPPPASAPTRARQPGLGGGFTFPPTSARPRGGGAHAAAPLVESSEMFELGQASEEDEEEGQGEGRGRGGSARDALLR
ncbi:hypothetical protein JCM9279_006840 [Rhodotorula babjevae]